ncbi:transcriptional regulator NarL [Kitasatospora sp. Ki12]|uniref:LuxR C-terminal-related transcriptional regulator n=1 Tax=Kitasatospora xanthocidica TaxID=83382 RepID=UPI0016734B8B|nr:response regulator transcription factor [Kitasatospora xanthocidica]GHF37063.1 DNA-binding response regulator [Kitasatospora xanthocidica]
MEIPILICVGQPLMRSGLSSALVAEPDIRVVGETSAGSTASELARELNPAVVVTDFELADMTGIDLVRDLLGPDQESPRTLLMAPPEDDAVLESILAGATGIVTRNTMVEDFPQAIRATATGHSFLSPDIAALLLGWVRDKQPALFPALSLNLLTYREREILALLANGMSNAEISKRLCIVQSTVKFHISQLLRKLGLRDRLQAAVFAHQNGVI